MKLNQRFIMKFINNLKGVFKLRDSLSKNLKSKYIECDGTKKDIYFQYSEKIKASEKVRRDINIASDPIQMLDLSLLCIYFLTDDKAFYETNRNKLIEFVCNYEKK